MDKFTKAITVIAFTGTVICAGVNQARKAQEADPNKLTFDKQQFEIDAKAAEAGDEEWPEFIFGGPYSDLEKEKEYIAYVTSSDRYIAESYYLGDHYSDPRLVVVRSETTGDVSQVFTSWSYQKRSEVSQRLDEVPD